ncbi:MAG: metallophosphoesterase family protein [Planctomycetes bacterium]|nr:metallophosphoesterase family protein [Planctomycetota bacterium]
MKRATSAVLFLAVAICQARADDGTFGPYLQSSAPASVTVRWRTAVPATAAVEFGPAGGDVRAIYEVEPREEHAVRLEGLLPDTVYVYRALSVEGETLVFSAEGRFRTLPAGTADAVRFACVSGSGWGGFEDQVAAFDPHIVLAASGSAGEEGLEGWDAHYSRGAAVAGAAPLYPAVGAGNYARTGLGGTPFLGHLNLFHRLHTLPGNEEWYSVRAGSVLFLVTNSTWYADPLRLSIDQIEWLDRELQSATDGKDDPLFKVLLSEAPAPGSGRDPRGVAEELWSRALIERLVARRGVDLVLAGHGTHTEHSARSGVHYLSVATAGPGGARWESRSARSALFFDESSRTIATARAAGRTLSVDVQDDAGQVLHSFSIERE